MRKIFFLLMSMFACNAFSQSVSAAYVNVYTHTNAVEPVVNGRDDLGNIGTTFLYSYEHYFKNKKYSAHLSFMKFEGCSYIYFEEGGVIGGGGDLLAIGFCAGAGIKRFDLGASYLLTKKNKKFYFKPSAAAGLQFSHKTGIEFWGTGLPINGPNYFELEPMSAISMNTTQIAPSIGFKTGFVFWKRLDVGLTIQGVYAFKPYQKMYLKYQYKGTDQPMAEYESTGTGLFVSLGVGYRFAKFIK